MSETLADAGHAPAASEQTSEAPATNDAVQNTETVTAESPMRAAFENAKAELAGEERPKEATKPAPEAIKPHDRWTTEEKAVFATLPQEAQKAMLDQYGNWERGYQKKFEETASARRLKEEIDPLFTPEVRQMMKSRNLTEGQVIGQLADFAKRLDTDPVGAIAHLMQRHRVDPRVFLQGQAPQAQQIPEAVQQFAPLLQPLFAEIASLKQGQNAWRVQQQAEQERAIEATIASVAEAKDENGVPAFPHMERVADRMADLIENDPRYANMDPRKRLEEAYTVAVFSDPELRAGIASAEASKRALAMEQERANGSLKRAATSKPAASSTGSKSAKMTIRGAFEETKRELGM